MPNRPKKLDAKSQRILEQVERCITELAGGDYAPPGFEKRPDTPESRNRVFKRLPAIRDNEYHRLKAWLVALEEENKAAVYSAVLQVWLNVHEIAWPEGVFQPDLATFGSGILASGLGAEAQRLYDQGKTWGQIAQKLLPDECKTADERRKASDKVRLAADAHKNGVRRERPIEGSVAERVWQMLDVKPGWLLEQEIRDELDEETEDAGS